MWVVDTDREGLLRTLQAEEGGGGARPASKKGLPLTKQGSVRLIWRKKEELGELPVGVMVPEGELGEFFAWTNTYVPNWCPISAFFRVISWTDDLWDDGQGSRSVGDVYETASVGLTIGEALVQSGARFDVERVPLSGCIATFSFVAARGVKRGIAIEDLAERWDVCRRITGQDALAVRISELVVPWQMLINLAKNEGGGSRDSAASGSRKAVEDALRDVVKKGEVGSAAWRAVTRGFPEVRNAMKYMADTQETRMLAFERMLKETVMGRKARSSEASFLMGYVASLIAPGSVKHAHMLLDHIDRLSTAVMWLSLFASIYRKSQLRVSKLAHLVWRAIAEEEELLARPRSDIGLAELCVLQDAGVVNDSLRGTTRGRLIVELMPCVSTIVRWPRQEGVGDSQGQGELFSGQASQLNSITRALEGLRGELDEVTRRLQHVLAKRY